jgi:predicted TIM-barrel fold metal-dependent hydrolase
MDKQKLTRRQFLTTASAAVASGYTAVNALAMSQTPDKNKIKSKTPMLIDAHAHVYADPKIRPGPKATTFLSAAQQIDLMDSLGIEKAIILPLNNSETTGEPQSMFEIQYICDKYPGRFIPFCNVDPRRTKFMAPVTVDYFLFVLSQYKDFGCKGLGELAAKVYWDDPALMMLFEACEKVGFPVTFHTTTTDSYDYGLIDELGFPRFEKVLKRFPKLIFLAHSQSWWAEISSDIKLEEKSGYPKDPVVPGGAVPRLMKKYPQIYGDLSANSGYNALARDPQHAYKFIERFQDRLVFALDYCSLENERKLLQWLKAALADGNISKQAYENMTYKNIARILNLNI